MTNAHRPYRTVALVISLDPALFGGNDLVSYFEEPTAHYAGCSNLDGGTLEVMTTVESWTGREAKALRKALRLSVRDFAGRLGVAMRTVNKWEARLADITPRDEMQRALDTALARAPEEVQSRFAMSVQTSDPSPGSVNGAEVSWVDRRDFINTVMALTLGVGAHPELERLETLLPAGGDHTDVRRVGDGDVDVIEAVTAAFRAQDFQYGGGVSRAAAVAQLRAMLPLQDVSCSDAVRGRLLVALADLAKTAAWMTFDVEDHDAARRLWMIALDTARRAEHPRSTDLTVTVLLNMTNQAVLHLDRPQEGLKLVQLAGVTAASGKYPISVSTRVHTTAYLGLCRAALGEAQPCQAALSQTLEDFAEVDPTTAPPWAQHVTVAEIAAQQGHSLFLLSRTDPAYAPQAIEQLRTAAEGDGPAYARSRALRLPGLAASHFFAGNHDMAVQVGHQAVTAISRLYSPRACTRLRWLDAAAQPHASTPDVTELRERIRTTLTTA